MRIALDAMGGDHAPGPIVAGAVEAVRQIEGLTVVLVGDRTRVEHELATIPEVPRDRLPIVHASEAIGMDEKPVEALRKKRDNSISVCRGLMAKGEARAVVSAGNTGAGGNISSPGTAKNVITVGASENYRPEGQDSCGPDGKGGIGPDGADSALDLLRYSSGGPTADGRAKPDLAAPGTHVYGAASKSPFFFGVSGGPWTTCWPSDADFHGRCHTSKPPPTTAIASTAAMVHRNDPASSTG